MTYVVLFCTINNGEFVAKTSDEIVFVLVQYGYTYSTGCFHKWVDVENRLNLKIYLERADCKRKEGHQRNCNCMQSSSCPFRSKLCPNFYFENLNPIILYFY